MKTNKDNASALPYLDTIETTQNPEIIKKAIDINSYGSFSEQNEYEGKPSQLQESDLFGTTPVSDSEFMEIEEWERQCNSVSQELANEFESERLFKEQEDNSKTIKSAEYYKHLTDELAGLLIYEDSILQERAEKMLDCGTYLEYYDDKLIGANFCRQRICPNCQRRRALRTCVDVKKMQQLLDGNGYKYLHLVLTVPNCEAFELSDTIDRLYAASSKLFKTREFKNKFKGVIRCLEVTYNARKRIHSSDGEIHGNCFHPHLHCLVLVSRSYGSGKNYLSHAFITGSWMACYGSDCFLDVHIAAVKNGDDKAIAEIAKYCVKPLDLDCPASERREVLEILYEALHGRRLVQLYGLFRDAAKKLKIDLESLTDDVKELDVSKIHRYTYNRYKRSYELSGGF